MQLKSELELSVASRANAQGAVRNVDALNKQALGAHGKQHTDLSANMDALCRDSQQRRSDSLPAACCRVASAQP